MEERKGMKTKSQNKMTQQLIYEILENQITLQSIRISAYLQKFCECWF